MQAQTLEGGEMLHKHEPSPAPGGSQGGGGGEPARLAAVAQERATFTGPPRAARVGPSNRNPGEGQDASP